MKKILNEIKTRGIMAVSVVHAESFANFKNPLGANDNIFDFIKSVADVVARIGAAIVVIMVIYSGFLFVQAQGNEEKLKTARKNLMWTLIGAVVLLGAATLAAVVSNVAGDLGFGIN